MNYGDEPVAKIPTAAITAEDAMRIQRLVNRGLRVRLRLKMEAHFEPDVESFNVVGEIRGSEKPDEIVLVGGHFDSWDPGHRRVGRWGGVRGDVGGGAADEEAEHPARSAPCAWCCSPTKRTACAAATAIATRMPKEAANHILALESDSGVFAPARLGFSGSEAARRDHRRHRHAARAARHAGDWPGRRRRRHRPDRARSARCR